MLKFLFDQTNNAVVLTAVLAIALSVSNSAQAQVPWTPSDLLGGFAEVSGINAGGSVLTISTEPMVLTTNNTAQALELELTFASPSAMLPADIRLGIWNDEQSFTSGGVDTLSATVLLNESAIITAEENYSVAQTGSPIHIYSATFNEANLGTVEYTQLVNAIQGNLDNRYSIYSSGDGEPLNLISSISVGGDVLTYQSPQGNLFEFDEGLATQAILQAVTAEPVLGDVNLDGEVNFSDIAPFIAVLAAETFQAEADTNQDGEVDFFDIASFIALLSGQ